MTIESTSETKLTIDQVHAAMLDADVILVSTSGGKDSTAMKAFLSDIAKQLGILDRLVAVHCDLGRAEWEGTEEIARAQAEQCGIKRFEVVRRPQGDFLDLFEQRGMWPSPKIRLCTSSLKRNQVSRVITQVVREWQAANPNAGRPCRVLDCQGLRAAESPKRAKQAQIARNEMASNGKREVTTFLPIKWWTDEQVWGSIKAAGLPIHRAYGLGMNRLSCIFCIYANRDTLLLAGEHNRERLEEFVAAEDRMGHTFKADLSLREIKEALDRGERANLSSVSFDAAL